MDSIDLLRSADRTLLSLVEGLGEPDLTRPTPCAGWDVRALLSHTIATIDAFAAAVDGQDGPSESEIFSGADRLGTAPADAVRASVARSETAWSSIDDWDASVTTALGAMPGAQAIAIVTYSTLVHGWDVATALGRPVEFGHAEAALAEAVGGQIVPVMRPGGLFGPEVAVADTATPTERVVAFSGRHPH